ncbi:MAG: hypothetical protein C6W56_14450 [Caldibacillus debilis]|nr:MAG: hypothetical protein BAA03_09930 [Caldibacillus debilis]REJ24397.1 MAG: hypothetical protein C6W56_14450 [Caldibacillus debilis]
MRRMETAYPSVAENGSHHFMAPCRRNGYPPKKMYPQEGAFSGKRGGEEKPSGDVGAAAAPREFSGPIGMEKRGGTGAPGNPFSARHRRRLRTRHAAGHFRPGQGSPWNQAMPD